MKFKLTATKIKIRRSWGEIRPVTTRINSKRIYVRKHKFNNGVDFDE